MGLLDKVKVYKDFLQASFENAMTTVERIHQTSVSIPIDMLREVGYPADQAEQIKETHARLLRILYGGIAKAHDELGELVVQQVGQLTKLAEGMLEDRDRPPTVRRAAVMPAAKTEDASVVRRTPRAPAPAELTASE